MTFESLIGLRDAFHPIIHEIRNHKGQKKSAERVRSLTLDNVNLKINKNNLFLYNHK